MPEALFGEGLEDPAGLILLWLELLLALLFFKVEVLLLLLSLLLLKNECKVDCWLICSQEPEGGLSYSGEMNASVLWISRASKKKTEATRTL